MWYNVDAKICVSVWSVRKQPPGKPDKIDIKVSSRYLISVCTTKRHTGDLVGLFKNVLEYG